MNASSHTKLNEFIFLENEMIDFQNENLSMIQFLRAKSTQGAMIISFNISLLAALAKQTAIYS